MLSSYLYKEMNSSLVQTKEWFDTYFTNCIIDDISIFRISHRIGPITNISDNPVDIITKQLYTVDFMKLIYRVDEQLQLWNYTSPYTPACNTKMFNQDAGCMYMPNGVVMTVEDPGNIYGEEVVIGKETTGKNICTKIDSTSLMYVRSSCYFPTMHYVDMEYDLLPKLKYVKDIPKYVLDSISLLAYIGRLVYELTEARDGSNGVFIVPITVLKVQLDNLVSISNKYV